MDSAGPIGPPPSGPAYRPGLLDRDQPPTPIRPLALVGRTGFCSPARARQSPALALVCDGARDGCNASKRQPLAAAVSRAEWRTARHAKVKGGNKLNNSRGAHICIRRQVHPSRSRQCRFSHRRPINCVAHPTSLTEMNKMTITERSPQQRRHRPSPDGAAQSSIVHSRFDVSHHPIRPGLTPRNGPRRRTTSADTITSPP
jgi:hypothetical protein